jgi:hypothetical protein
MSKLEIFFACMGARHALWKEKRRRAMRRTSIAFKGQQ